MKCDLNCFECPYPDCLTKERDYTRKDKAKTTERQKKKNASPKKATELKKEKRYSFKRFTDEELKQHKKEYNKRYWESNRLRISEQRKAKRAKSEGKG